MSRILHKQLTMKEALEYVCFAVWSKDLPEGFDGNITCDMNDDGSVDVYAVFEEDEEELDEKTIN